MASSRPSKGQNTDFGGANIPPLPPSGWSTIWLRIALPLAVLLSACGATDPVPQVAADDAVPQTHHLTVTAPTLEHLERYGAAVAVDDHRAVVGAWGNSRNGHESGAAYVYRYAEGTNEWALDGGILSPDDLAAGSRFGHAVALGEDLVAVSAIYDGSRGYRAGAVYLFERGSDEQGADGWQQRAKLLPPPGSDNAHFGSAIVLEQETLAVSSAGASASRIDLYRRTDEGWQKSASLSAPAAATGQYFGGDIALREDALVVGASHRENAGPGSVYLYRRGEEGWGHRATLQSATDQPLFGTSVDLGPAGLLGVGAPDPVQGGAVYLYRLMSEGDGGFDARQEQVLRPQFDGHPHFGSALALLEETVIVGSPGATYEGRSSGLVQVYRNEGVSEGWALASQIAPSSPADDLSFGITVAASDLHLTIGATGMADGGTISGGVEIVTHQLEPAYTND